MKPRKKLWTFRGWLTEQMRQKDLSVYAVSEIMHCSKSMVYRHLKSIHKPNFSTVISYCYVFGCLDEAETIWRKACEEHGKEAL